MHKIRARLERARETFWVMPAGGILLGLALGLLTPALDTGITLPASVAISGQADTARATLAAIATLGVSIAGVSFSVIVVALVLASQQLSPRVLRSFQRRALNQAVLALLLGTATYALFVLGSVSDEREEPLPELAVTLAMVLAAASLGLFVLFLHHVVRSLNASAVIRRIAADGHQAVAAPYPAGAGREPDDAEAVEAEARRLASATDCAEVRAPRAGYVASVDAAGIVAWASEHDAFVEQRRGVGEFVVTGAVLGLVHGSGDIDPEAVAGRFLIEEERVVEGDVGFPLRQLVDIALKGLSPGVNDPTTAENAMDSVADTLVRFARRPKPSTLRVGTDGAPRLRARTASLDDLVRLGFDQVRRDAANRPSFAVRLLELLADLREAAPPAGDSREIRRQAELIADQAARLAEEQGDQEMVGQAYERLHGGGGGRR